MKRLWPASPLESFRGVDLDPRYSLSIKTPAELPLGGWGVFT